MSGNGETLLLEYHRLVREDVLHEDERRWVLFGAFLIAETLLASLLRNGHDAIVGGLGVVSTALIGIAIWRNNVYLRDRSLLAADLETLLAPQLEVLARQLEEKRPGRSVTLRFYTEKGRLPPTRLARQYGYGMFPSLKRALSRAAAPAVLASAVMRTTLLLTIVAWGTLISIALHGDSRIVGVIAVGLVLLILVDWLMEIEQRLKAISEKGS